MPRRHYSFERSPPRFQERIVEIPQENCGFLHVPWSEFLSIEIHEHGKSAKFAGMAFAHFDQSENYI